MPQGEATGAFSPSHPRAMLGPLEDLTMTPRKPALLLCCIRAAVAVCGCDDSKAPLSDLKTAEADERLYGLWKVRQNNDAVEYYHVGHVPDAPAGLLRVIGVSHPK